MKIAHLNTHYHGGAATSALNLHHSLTGGGIDSCFLTSKELENFHSGESLNRAYSLHFADRVRTDVSNTFFTLSPFTKLSLDHPDILDADIIHLHWVSGLVDSIAIRRLYALGKHLVWTLHDVRPLTGGCHFPAGCEQFTNGCQCCIQVHQSSWEVIHRDCEMKFNALRSVPIHLVGPSRWMVSQAVHLNQHTGGSLSYIPYGVDIVRFHRGEKVPSCGQLSLPENRRYILIGAHDMNEFRKGARLTMDVLRRAAALLTEADRRDWEIVCVGKASEEMLSDILSCGWQLRSLGYVDHELMPTLYSSCDILLFTPLEDNLPNMVLEALACGVVPVVTQVGGMTDMIDQGENGFVFSPSEPDSGARALSQLLTEPSTLSKLSLAAVESITMNFTMDKQREQIVALYERIMKEPLSVNNENYSIPDISVPMTELEQSVAGLFSSLEQMGSEKQKCEQLIQEQQKYISILESTTRERLECIQSQDNQLKELSDRVKHLEEQNQAQAQQVSELNKIHRSWVYPYLRRMI